MIIKFSCAFRFFVSISRKLHTSSVYLEKRGNVGTIVMNRPEVRNAIDGEAAKQLAAAVREFLADDSLRVGVLWGKGNFCAGADLKAIRNGTGCELTNDGDGPLGPTRIELTKPMIAAISGPAVAGGLELAIWCDLRVIEESAYFGVFCRNWGVPLIDGGTVRLPRLIGLSRAMDMILTGRAVYSAEALTMGLANRVVADGTSREAAESLAADLARLPQSCMLSDRRSTYAQFDATSFQDAMNYEFQNSKTIVDAQLVSYLEKFSGNNNKNN